MNCFLLTDDFEPSGNSSDDEETIQKEEEEADGDDVSYILFSGVFIYVVFHFFFPLQIVWFWFCLS